MSADDMVGRWSYVPMPVDKDGNGPASPEDTAHTRYEVWTACYQTVAVCYEEHCARVIVDEHNRTLDAAAGQPPAAPEPGGGG